MTNKQTEEVIMKTQKIKTEKEIGDNIIEVCEKCGKVDAVFGDNHDCFLYTQNQDAQEYYD